MVTWRVPIATELVGSKPFHPPSHHSTHAWLSPVTGRPTPASGVGCRYPETYRAGSPRARSRPTATCEMSWQTPLPVDHACMALVFTLVAPPRYSMFSPT